MRLRKTTATKRGWRCPDVAMVAAYADGRLEGKPQLQFERHLAGCGHCLNELAFLLRAQEPAEKYDVSATLIARARSFPETKAGFSLIPAWGWATLSAAAVLVVLVVSVELRPPRADRNLSSPAAPTESEERTSTAPAVIQPSSPIPPAVRNAPRSLPSPELIFPSEGAIVPRQNVAFRWREVKRSIDYEVVVVTAEGDIVWEDRTETTRARLPHNISLNPGQKYFVWVRADQPEGRAAKSATVSFRAGTK